MLWNILLSAAKPSRFFVMSTKLLLRFFDKKQILTKKQNIIWCEENRSSIAEFCEPLDPSLWLETQKKVAMIEKEGNKKLSKVNIDLGGGGAIGLLYFLTRFNRPDVVVETGVAAGFSSYAFLLAIEINKKGSLYSSDFPYFRISSPEKYIGLIVPESLKKPWKLYLDGDAKNLVIINNYVSQIDIFHYDSDKSYSGREKSLDKVLDKMNIGGFIVMDDIQDNCFFHDLVKRYEWQLWHVFKVNEKFVGLLKL